MIWGSSSATHWDRSTGDLGEYAKGKCVTVPGSQAEGVAQLAPTRDELERAVRRAIEDARRATDVLMCVKS